MFELLKTYIPRPIQWVKELVGSGDPRVHAVVVLITAVTLCRCAIILTRAVYLGKQAYLELGVVVTGLTTIVTIIYNIGKKKRGTQ